MAGTMATSFEINHSATDAFIAFSFIAAALLFAPVIWQFQHQNSGAASLGFWIIVGNLTKAVRSSGTIWKSEVLMGWLLCTGKRNHLA